MVFSSQSIGIYAESSPSLVRVGTTIYQVSIDECVSARRAAGMYVKCFVCIASQRLSSHPFHRLHPYFLYNCRISLLVRNALSTTVDRRKNPCTERSVCNWSPLLSGQTVLPDLSLLSTPWGGVFFFFSGVCVDSTNVGWSPPVHWCMRGTSLGMPAQPGHCLCTRWSYAIPFRLCEIHRRQWWYCAGQIRSIVL